MNKNVIKTKKNLTIIFTMIVFLIVLLLGFTFLSFKYFNVLRIEKQSFFDVVKKIEKGNLDINNSNNIPVGLPNQKTGRKGDNMERIPMGRNFNSKGFINHISLEDNNITTSNIKDDISEDFIIDLLDSKKYHSLELNDGFLIKKIISEKDTLILFKKLRYTFSDYSYDILLFILVNILFSSILYYIGYKFVNRAFIPVEENLKDMNDFVHNAGHEFKTPLSVIDSNIQLIKDTKKYSEEMLDEIKSESKKLNSLIDSLVRLIDMDTSKNTDHNNLKKVIDEVLSDFTDNITKRKLTLKVDVDKNVIINADKNYLYILLSNIIGNAIKYNNDKGNINIFYKLGELTIEDSGVGIPQEHIINIFDRFFKVDSSRNSEGFGIGLSLVKKIADIYHRNIDVESSKEGGSSFKIRF